MNNRDKITEIIYKNSTDSGEGLIIGFEKIEGVIDKLNELNKSQDKKAKDLLNWVKSDISQEKIPKLGRTATPYRREKLRFLRKIQQMLIPPCKYVKREGESCTLNNNCKFPNCEQ